MIPFVLRGLKAADNFETFRAASGSSTRGLFVIIGTAKV